MWSRAPQASSLRHDTLRPSCAVRHDSSRTAPGVRPVLCGTRTPRTCAVHMARHPFPPNRVPGAMPKQAVCPATAAAAQALYTCACSPNAGAPTPRADPSRLPPALCARGCGSSAAHQALRAQRAPRRRAPAAKPRGGRPLRQGSEHSCGARGAAAGRAPTHAGPPPIPSIRPGTAIQGAHACRNLRLLLPGCGLVGPAPSAVGCTGPQQACRCARTLRRHGAPRRRGGHTARLTGCFLLASFRSCFLSSLLRRPRRPAPPPTLPSGASVPCAMLGRSTRRAGTVHVQRRLCSAAPAALNSTACACCRPAVQQRLPNRFRGPWHRGARMRPAPKCVPFAGKRAAPRTVRARGLKRRRTLPGHTRYQRATTAVARPRYARGGCACAPPAHAAAQALYTGRRLRRCSAAQPKPHVGPAFSCSRDLWPSHWFESVTKTWPHPASTLAGSTAFDYSAHCRVLTLSPIAAPFPCQAPCCQPAAANHLARALSLRPTRARTLCQPCAPRSAEPSRSVGPFLGRGPPGGGGRLPPTSTQRRARATRVFGSHLACMWRVARAAARARGRALRSPDGAQAMLPAPSCQTAPGVFSISHRRRGHLTRRRRRPPNGGPCKAERALRARPPAPTNRPRPPNLFSLRG
jgi:hypothetical protein